MWNLKERSPLTRNCVVPHTPWGCHELGSHWGCHRHPRCFASGKKAQWRKHSAHLSRRRKKHAISGICVETLRGVDIGRVHSLPPANRYSVRPCCRPCSLTFCGPAGHIPVDLALRVWHRGHGFNSYRGDRLPMEAVCKNDRVLCISSMLENMLEINPDSPTTALLIIVSSFWRQKPPIFFTFLRQRRKRCGADSAHALLHHVVGSALQRKKKKAAN